MLWKEPGCQGIPNDAYFDHNCQGYDTRLCQEKDDTDLYYENVHGEKVKEKDEGIEYSMDSLGLRYKDF